MYLPYVITLESVLRKRIIHLRCSLASAGEVAALRTFTPGLAGGIIELAPVLTKGQNRQFRFQRLTSSSSIKTRNDVAPATSATMVELESKLLSLEAVQRVFLFQATAVIMMAFAMFALCGKSSRSLIYIHQIFCI